MTKKKVSKKRKNPADSTMRNVRACNKRLQFLEHRINTLCAALNDYRDQMTHLAEETRQLTRAICLDVPMRR